jgi:hypothetical protein
VTDEKFKDVFEKMKALPDVFGIAYVDGVFLIAMELIAMEGADERFQEADFEGCRARLISYFHFRLLDDQYKLWEEGPAVPKRRSPEEELQQFLPPGAKIVSVVGDDVTFTLKLKKPLASVDIHIPDISKEPAPRD